MAKRLLVIYYSQSGQLRNILNSLLKPIMDAGVEADFYALEPDPPFPFPWTSAQFFDAFPESHTGIPCKLKPLPVPADKKYDLVILGYAPWYLSPSIPIHSFMQSVQARELLSGMPVVTVIGSRNMWMQAQERMKKYFVNVGAKLVGNIALVDEAPNLTSVLTIIRWLIKGKQEAGRFLPRAGVSEKDILNSSTFGESILNALNTSDLEGLQESLIEKGAVEIKPNFVLFERNGSKIFKMWSRKILKKGPYGDPRRKTACRLFKWYLLIVLFIVSPLANIVYFFIKLFISSKIRRERFYFSHNGLAENQ